LNQPKRLTPWEEGRLNWLAINLLRSRLPGGRFSVASLWPDT
jgi:hypothetical protein